MARAVFPIFTDADREAVLPVLDALKKAGLSVREGGDPGPGDAVLLFLTASLRSDSPEAEEFFRLDAKDREIIPVNLDGSQPPDVIRNALYARNTISAMRYSPAELAERIRSALKKPSRAWIWILLALVVLGIAGGLFWMRTKVPPEEPETAPAAEETATPEPTAEPTPEPTPGPFGMTQEDLEDIREAVFIGDTVTWVRANGKRYDGRLRGLDEFAYRTWEDDSPHWYSMEDGHEYILGMANQNAFEAMKYMPNLYGVTMILVDGEFPDLSGIPKLIQVVAYDCTFPDLEGFRGATASSFLYMGGNVKDFSPLTDGTRVNTVELDLYATNEADFSGFAPPYLYKLVIENGWGLSDIDLSGLSACTGLQSLELQGVPVMDLTFLKNADILQDLSLSDLERLETFSGFGSHENLLTVEIQNCPRLSDISDLGTCRKLTKLRMELRGDNHRLTDFSSISSMPGLNNLELYGVDVTNLDFLQNIRNRSSFAFGISSGSVSDWEGLSAIRSYSWLNIDPGSRSIRPALEALSGIVIGNLNLSNCSELDLAMLPTVTGMLRLSRCRLENLQGLSGNSINGIELEDMQILSSLDGLQDLSKFHIGGMGKVRIYGCPRLTDWSALDGMKLEQLSLTGTYMLPDLSAFTADNYRFDRLVDVTDLSFLSALDHEKRFASLELIGMDEVSDISPLFSLKGTRLSVPAHLAAQAQDLVARGNFRTVEISYPEGGWEPDNSAVTLLSLEELDTLPASVLRRVESVSMAGDAIFDRDQYYIDDDWNRGKQEFYLVDDATGERTKIQKGSFTEFGRFSELENLRCLDITGTPLKNLEGIQPLTELEELTVRDADQLSDISAAFTLQNLRRLTLCKTAVTSLEGIQNLYQLESLEARQCGKLPDISVLFDMPSLREICVPNAVIRSIEGVEKLPNLVRLEIGYTNVKDLTPLSGLDFSCAEAEGGFQLGVDGLTDALKKTGSVLSGIPGFQDLNVYNASAAVWMDLISGVPVKKLWAGNASMTQAQLEQLAKEHPELEELNIESCQKVSDLTPLLSLENLRSLHISKDMKKAIASLDGKRLGFELLIFG